MRPFLVLLILIGILMPVTWWRAPKPRKTDTLSLTFVPVALSASERKRAKALAPFRLERIWRIESRYRHFGGYSGLVSLDDGQLLAVSDAGAMLRFSPPDRPQEAPLGAPLWGAVKGPKTSRDFEALTADISSNTFWASMEFENAIVRLRPDKHGKLLREKEVKPSGMAQWGDNSGGEALVRLRDGSFLVLQEGFSSLFESERHEALRFRADPIEAPDAEPFTLVGLDGMRPTDMTQMPDGRVLILFRRVQWVLPPKFAGAIAIGDPQQIRKGNPWPVRQVAAWGFGIPRDNFEGMTVEQGKNGRLIIWLISDDNKSGLQQTLLWKLTVDPKDLPNQISGGHEKGAR